MVSQNNRALPEETLGEQIERKGGFDFPKDFALWQRFAYECAHHLDDSETSSPTSSYCSSEPEALVVSPLYNALQSIFPKGVERKDDEALGTLNPNPIDAVTISEGTPNPNPIDVFTISDDEASESPEKVLPKGYKPHKRVVAVRDFPTPPTKFQTPCSEGQYSSPSYDEKKLESIKSMEAEPSEYKDELECGYGLISRDAIIPLYNISLISSEEGRDMPKVRGLVELNDLSETSEHEAMDLTEEVASNFTSPLDTIDSTTGSPNGYRGRGSPIREEGILESTSFKLKGFSHKLSDAEDPLLEAQSDSERFSKNSRQNSESLSSQCPNTTEKRVLNSPRSKKRSASRSSTTTDTNKRKREKTVLQSWASSSF
ncbi:hypothetical protein ES288_D08G219700v1 [Gossypium darwinii]|uniref:Uncharacterized protein n=1 Tax=Gossypium darwinii TaxID=34276 RepID=A0A5D2BLW1_GOSDA|nr:hypothetical protein ES288_D08G219700v1 [Gossypium darwinii]